MHSPFCLAIFHSLSGGALALPQANSGHPAQGIDIAQITNLTITTWNVAGCPEGSDREGQFGIYYDYFVVTDTKSYNLSRDLTAEEQLDWSVYTPNEGAIDKVPGACTLFVETSSPDSNNQPLKGNTCYSIQSGQANISLFFVKS